MNLFGWGRAACERRDDRDLSYRPRRARGGEDRGDDRDPIAGPITAQGAPGHRSGGGRSTPDAVCTRANRAVRTPAPRTVPTTPTTTPFARTMSLMFLSVAPRAPSMPIARRRRWAMTVNPPIATSAIRSIPSVASVSTIVSGFKTLPDEALEALETDSKPDPRVVTSNPPASKRIGYLRRGRYLPGSDQCELVEQALRNSERSPRRFSTCPSSLHMRPIARSQLGCEPTRQRYLI